MSIQDCTIGVTSFEEAEQLIEREDSDKVQSNLDFYYGDHWQNANGWSGPIPANTDAEYSNVSYEIERGFVSKNVIKEIVDRAVNGITGKDAIWAVVPKAGKEASQELVDEATAFIKEWMERAKFQRYLSEALRNALLSGKSTLRLFIPAGFVREGQVVIDTNDPIKNLYIDAPSPLAATVYECPQSKERLGVFVADVKIDGQDAQVAELDYLLPVANERGKRITEISLVPSRGDDMVSVQLDLGERLTMIEIEIPRLVTDQVRSLQMFLNLNMTMMQRNSVLGGFLERIILNGQLPGHYEEDADGTKTFVRDDFAVGAGTVNAITGIPVANESGQIIQYTPADIRYQQPVEVKTFVDASDQAYRNILESSDQLHALISGDAISSGESRRQALHGFFSALKIPKQQVEQAGKWTFETVLAFAAFLTGQAGRFEDLTVNFNSRLDLGALPAEEINLIGKQVELEILSKKTARERIGIEDVEEEQRRVDAERTARGNKPIQTGGVSNDTGLPISNLDNSLKDNEVIN